MLTKHDIFEIIEKVLESEDRYLSIYIANDGGISVSIYPMAEDEEDVIDD